MDRKLVCVAVVALALQIIGATRVVCPDDPNCVCGGTLALELKCDIDGRTVIINLLPNTYISIKCENATSLDYDKLPKCANRMNTFKSVSFKDCPLPSSSFKDVLTNMGVSKTMALIFQNAKNLSGFFDRKHFSGLQDLTKLLLSVNGVSHLPDNLFADINKLTWLNIRSNTINLSEELFKPLEKLETLEISHNHMTNISSNLFSHLSYLRKLSLWQSNVTWFSKDLFTGVDVLEELDLSSNGLNELPSSIFKPLRKLKKLTLFSNKFSSLPQNLFKHNEELETVVILNNDAKLVELPKYLFGGMSNLQQIYIQRSGLEKLPYDVFANSPQMTNISLAYNDLRALPEAIFNDQINLLELDLSHNKLSSLEPKLFSSLVRLEMLNLNHNLLTKICGSTFSALLSLIYLNMEHNNLKTISSHLFSNNKQRMSISLAYNKLSFEEKEMRNNSCVVNRFSPFAETYNLRLLNLSHNNFNVTFADWWINGHEDLDISHNFICNLWEETNNANGSYQDLIKKPVRHVWVSENPILCICPNLLFLDYLSLHNSQIVDRHEIRCYSWNHAFCFMKSPESVPIFAAIFIFQLFALMTIFITRKRFTKNIKENLLTLKTTTQSRSNFLAQDSLHHEGLDKSTVIVYYDNGNYIMVVEYDARDSYFVDKQLMPGLLLDETSPIELLRQKNMTKREKLLKWLKNPCCCMKNNIDITVFTSNFLEHNYSHVEIKQIKSKMLVEKSIFIFADIGPENSLYTFLKSERDTRNSVVWGEPNFWEKVSILTEVEEIALMDERSANALKLESDGKRQVCSLSFTDEDGNRTHADGSLFKDEVISTKTYKV